MCKGEDPEKNSKLSDQDNKEVVEEVNNEEPVVDSLSYDFFRDALCSDMGMYLIYLIIALISILVARRFYSA